VAKARLLRFFFRKLALRASIYPPSHKTMGVDPWMNATVGPSEARRAKEGASADSTEERKDTTGVNPWRLHDCHWM
jgi:hypothetical protein